MIRVAAILLATSTPLAAETLRIGTSPTYPPYISLDAQGVRIGLDVDLADAICARGGYDCIWVDMNVNQLIPALAGGEIDLIMGGIGYSLARDAVVDFTCPYYVSFDPHVNIYTRDENVPLDGARIAVVGETLHSVAIEAAGYKTVPYPDSDAALGAFLAGKADAFAGAPNIVERLPDDTVIVFREAHPTPTTGAAIAIAEDRPDLMTAIEGHLAAISADGRLGRMLESWAYENQGDVIADCRPTYIGS